MKFVVAVGIALQRGDQPVERTLPELSDADLHRREAEEPGERNVVETGNGDVAGYAATASLKRLYRAERHHIVRGEHRIERVAARDERRNRGIARLLLELALNNLQRNARFFGGLAASGCAFLRVHIVLWSGDVHQLAPAKACQMGDHRAHARGIVQADACMPAALPARDE